MKKIMILCVLVLALIVSLLASCGEGVKTSTDLGGSLKIPAGVYVSSTHGAHQTVTSDGNTLTIYSSFETRPVYSSKRGWPHLGKHIYEYCFYGFELSEVSSLAEARHIKLTDVVTNEVIVVSFKYLGNYNTIVLDGEPFIRE